MLTYFFGCYFGSFSLTVIWVAKVLSYGLCFHPNSVEISLGSLTHVSAGYVMERGEGE